VVSGLMLSRIGPRVVRADTRRQAQAFFSPSTFLLNGAQFVLVGLELLRQSPACPASTSRVD
jgi:CPA1 family monovalent cation:H+ antiporter